MEHVKMRCTDNGPGCEDGNCNLCNLFMCKVCFGAECSLTTDCPGEPITEQRADEVCRGTVDFLGGEWIRINED